MCVPSFPYATPTSVPCLLPWLYWWEIWDCQHGSKQGVSFDMHAPHSLTLRETWVLTLCLQLTAWYSQFQGHALLCKDRGLCPMSSFSVRKCTTTELPPDICCSVMCTQVSWPNVFFPRQDQRLHSSLSVGSWRWKWLCRSSAIWSWGERLQQRQFTFKLKIPGMSGESCSDALQDSVGIAFLISVRSMSSSITTSSLLFLLAYPTPTGPDPAAFQLRSTAPLWAIPRPHLFGIVFLLHSYISILYSKEDHALRIEHLDFWSLIFRYFV